jgi:hypothetical protein
LPFVQVVEAYPLDGELVEEQGNTTHGWPDESEPPCWDELRDDAWWHSGRLVSWGAIDGLGRSSLHQWSPSGSRSTGRRRCGPPPRDWSASGHSMQSDYAR